jgi:formate transporter
VNQSEQPHDAPSLDALLPPAMAQKAEDVGVMKARLPVGRLFALAVLAGSFIALGAAVSTTAVSGWTGHVPYGFVRVLGGVTFSLGLVLVIVGGAELFTGNNLIVMAWAGGKVSTTALLRNWTVSYAGNLVGALATVFLVYASGQYLLGKGVVGVAALTIADSKCALSFFQAVASGILCNALVCLAVWLSLSARTTTDRVLAVVPPITAFVTCGFEHSIANMYFIPLGLLIKATAPDSFWHSVQLTQGDLPNLNWQAFLLNNLLPVTLGNILGGSLLVGLVYWFVYLRRPRSG